MCTGLRSRCDYCVGAGGTKKKGGGCVRVSGRGATDVWKEKTHNIRGGGGCECVRSRSGTDVCKEKTHNIVGGVYVYSQCGQSKGTVP